MKQEVINEFLDWIKNEKKQDIIYQKIGAAYIRVSTDKQDEYSPISQLKIIWEWMERNNIYLNPDFIFIEDDGVSGRKANKRAEFQKMIGTAKQKPKPFDVLGLWKFSRFARNQDESILYKSLLRKQCQIDVISVSEPLIDGPFGSLIERIIEWMDEYYSTNLSGEVTRGMTEKANKGGLQTSPAYGYYVENNRLLVKEDEANIVKLIFKLYTVDNLSILDIAKKLYQLNAKTKKGNNFENRTIYYILQNPVYIGKLRWTPTGKTYYNFNNPDSIIADGDHESIIDLDTWNLTQEKIKKNDKWRKPRQILSKDITYWLKGLVRCKECNCTFVRYNKKWIRCNGYAKGKCDNGKILKIDEVENMIINKIQDDFKNPLNIKFVKKKKTNNSISEKDILLNQLKILEKKEARIKEAYMNGIDSIAEYKENKHSILAEKNILQNKINNHNFEPDNQEKIKKVVENGKGVYEVINDPKIDITKKHEIIHVLINKVEYDDSTNKLTLFYN